MRLGSFSPELPGGTERGVSPVFPFPLPPAGRLPGLFSVGIKLMGDGAWALTALPGSVHRPMSIILKSFQKSQFFFSIVHGSSSIIHYIKFTTHLLMTCQCLMGFRQSGLSDMPLRLSATDASRARFQRIYPHDRRIRA